MTLDDLEKEPLFAEWYTSHKVFERLSAIKNFYTVIFNRSFGFIETPLTKNFINTKCVLYPSIEGTIDSINILLNNGHINDAFALIRKYSDAIVLDIYKSIIIKETYEQFFNDVSWEVIANNKVSDWINAKSPLMAEHPQEEMKKIASTFPNIVSIMKLNPKKDDNCLYNKIRNLCNDNMHYNSFHIFLWNDSNYLKGNTKTTIKLLNNVYACLTFLSSMHFAFLYEYHPEYFMSSDYVDYLDFGEQPPTGAERWVAPYLNEFFSKVVYTHNKELGDYLISLDLMDLINGTEQDK